MRVAFRRKALSWYSRIIKIWTWGPYVHTELVFSDGTTFSSDESDGGTRFKTVGKDIELDLEQWDFLELPATAEEEARILAFCKKEDGLKYDWRGIAFSFLPIPIGWQLAERWFCSEIVVAAIQVAGWCSGYTPARVSPNKLHKILKEELEAYWKEEGTWPVLQS